MLSLIFSVLSSCPLFTLRIQTNAGSFPRPLSAKEEAECLRRLEEGDESARAELIEHNLRLVAHVIKKYYTQTDEQDDLISIGTIGLIKGVSSFRPDKGVRLATYASRCIENEILMHFRAKKKSAGDVSLSDAIDTDGEGNTLSLLDVISTEDDILDRLSTYELSAELHRAIHDSLDEREAAVIAARYGISGSAPLTQREVAQSLGISRSYVSRIEKKALEKLRDILDDKF